MVKKEEPSIHLRFEYDEAKNSKKELLYAQVEFLKAYQRLISYKKLRQEELLNKQKIILLSKEINNNLSHIERIFPKVILPKILKHEEKEKIIVEEEKAIQSITEYGTIEDQLKEIQKRLKALE